MSRPCAPHSRALIFAIGSVALLRALAVSVGVSLHGSGDSMPIATTPTVVAGAEPAQINAHGVPLIPAVNTAPNAAIDAPMFAIATPQLVTASGATPASPALPIPIDAGARLPAAATITDAGTTTPPLAEVPHARATLAVTAYPWGFVEVHGRPLGRSPMRVELSVGEHDVRVRADGLVNRRRVTVTAARTHARARRSRGVSGLDVVATTMAFLKWVPSSARPAA